MQDIIIAPAGSAAIQQYRALNVMTAPLLAVEFVVESAGATPTITFNVQGLKPGGSAAVSTDWVNLALLDMDASVATSNAAITLTAVGRTVKYLDGLDRRFIAGVAVNVTANTNIVFHANAWRVD